MSTTTEWPPAPDEPASPVFVLGCGAVGTALALGLSRRGVEVCGAHCRTEGSARRARDLTGLRVGHGDLPTSLAGARTIIVSVPDPAIPEAAAAVRGSGLLTGDEVALHCSGALSSEALSALDGAVRGRGSFHPLLSFADPVVAAEGLAGTFFGVDGDGAALAAARALAAALGGETLEIEGDDRALYHGAAVVASNHLVALAAHAARCLGGLGVDRETALEALLPLMASTLTNLRRVGLPRALTGPVSRGDAATVRAHLGALSARAPGEVELYLALAREALVVAAEKGAAADVALAEVAATLAAGWPERA